MNAIRPAPVLHGGGRAGLLILTIALVATFVTSLATAAPKFPPLTGRVVDNAQILSAEAEAKLTGELADLETRTGRQVVVATVPDLQGYEIEDFGYQLGRTWAIGSKDKDDGALFLIAPSERKVRIEVGYGLEPVLTDALSNVILQERVLPAFKAGRMEDGVVAGTEAIIQQLALPEDEAKARVAQASAQPAKSKGGGSAFPTIFVVFLVIWIVMGVLRGFGRRRRRGGIPWWLWPIILNSGSRSSRSGSPWGGGSSWGGGGGGGGFSGGGGSFGGGGSSGSW